MFTENFNRYVCNNDSISTECEGFTIIARIERDDDAHIDDSDCWSIDQSVTGCDDKQFAKLLADRKAWFDDEWFFCGISLSVYKDDIEVENHAASLWGIDANYPGSDNDYLTEVANELLPEAVEAGKSSLERMIEKLRA